MIKKTISSILVILHILTFGYVREGLAIIAESANYRLNALSINEGGKDRESSSNKIIPDAIGEGYHTVVIDSALYNLQSGYVWTIQSNPPEFKPSILDQNWQENLSNPDAFDLDDYFSSPDNLPLTYTYTKNASDATNKINVTIDPTTHMVSFSQPAAWYGTERVKFTAIDSDLNTCVSNEVSLQVEGVDNAPVIDYIDNITVNENDLVTITTRATDLDDDDITFSYSDSRFIVKPPEKRGGAWFSEATWQTDNLSAGTYTITITATENTALKLTGARTVNVTVNNINRPPVITKINNKIVTAGQVLILDSADENQLVVLNVTASDPDTDDILTYIYGSPFDQTGGTWQTTFASAGTHNFTVKVFDGREEVIQDATITINNVNQMPEIKEASDFTVSPATTEPNRNVGITVKVYDGDEYDQTLPFSLKKKRLSTGVIEDINTGVSRLVNNQTYTFTTSFASPGDYAIMLTATDSYNASVTQEKPVNVADPNLNRDAINPVMGDFNGDALSDLGVHISTSGSVDTRDGTWEICISKNNMPTQFDASQVWLTDFGTTRDWIPIGGDFNGDAKTDVGIYNNTTGELKVAVSTGSAFGTPQQWTKFSGVSYEWLPFTGNFNGDKYTDFGLYNKFTGECKISLSNGSSFGALNSWITNFGNNDYTPLAGDYNADGLTDLCIFQKSSGTFKVAFSNAARFIEEPSNWLTGFSQDKDPIISDFNNDGLTDIGYFDKSQGKWFYAPNTTTAFSTPEVEWVVNFGSSSDESGHTGDFDGDGITDAAVFDKDGIGINRWRWKLAKDLNKKPADLLVEIDNGIGGKTQITYDYAADYGTQELPFPVYVAKSISLINTIGLSPDTYTQDFTYEGGWFDADEREFRGFRMIRVTDPITANYSETYFYQGNPSRNEDGALKGQIETILAYDRNGKLISKILNTWKVRKAGPTDGVLGFPHLTEINSTVYEENDTYIDTRNKFKYDNLGNLAEETTEGDLSTDTDNKIATTLYNPAYLAGYNRPYEATLKDSNNNLLLKKTFEYDNYGNLTKETAYLDGINDPTTEYIYDSFGNVWKTINALDRTVETIYESTFNTYPETITNKLGHQIRYEYNAKFGVVTKITDVNNQTTETVYDSLARIIQQKNTQGQVVTSYSYPNFNTKITTQLNLTKTELIDGLGRLYQTISNGEDSGQPVQVSGEVYFDERGLKKYEVLPHVYSQSPPNPTGVPHIEYQYDIRGRINKTISYFSAGRQEAVEITYLTPLCTLTMDPKGVFKGIKKDVYGNTIEIIENTGNTIAAIQDPNRGYHTHYEYDLKGNLIKLTDSQGNITQIQYDRLGRKTSLNDPDTGITTYTYDKLGNLITQTDNKGNEIVMEYDVLSRLIAKRGLSPGSPQGTVPVTLATYDYDDTTKPNCLGRLSKVNTPGVSEGLPGGGVGSTTSYFYDSEGRAIKLDKTIDATTYTTQTTYDLIGRTTSITYPDGEVVYYLYDQNSGFLEAVSDTTEISGGAAVSDTAYVKQITYTATGQIDIIKYGNDVITDYNYGNDLRLGQILTKNSQLQTLQDLYYTFDLNGNIETITDNNDTSLDKKRRYRYDELNRLTDAYNVPGGSYGHTDFNYQYDPIGNMTYKSDVGFMTYNTSGVAAGLPGGVITVQGQTPPMPHAVTTAGSNTYTYDNNGNMLTAYTPQQGTKYFTYDVENHMVSLETSTETTLFTYDQDGSRIKKNSTNSITQQTQETLYISSLFEKDSSGETRKHIFAGSNRVASITTNAVIPAQAGIHYYHSDHLGSSNVITNEAGAQVSFTEYTPYGTIAKQTGSFSTPYKFTGKELDNTGLYYYGARYYDPVIARFITPDSIVQAPYDPQTLNRYSYCRNNPLKYTDPSGHIFGLIAAIIIGAIVGAVSAAISGGNVALGAFMGAFGGFLSFGISNAYAAMMGVTVAKASALQLATIGAATAFTTSVITGFISGANSRDIFKGALIGAGIAFAATYVVSSINGQPQGSNTNDPKTQRLQNNIKAGNTTGQLEQSAVASRKLIEKGVNPDITVDLGEIVVNPKESAILPTSQTSNIGVNWKTVGIGVGEAILGIGTVAGSIISGTAATTATGGLAGGWALIYAGSGVSAGLSVFALGMGEIANGLTGGKSISVEVIRTYYNTPPVVDAINVFE